MNSNAQTPAESSGERVAKRRRLILAGAGALAAVGGAGLAWWRLQPHAPAPGALAEVGGLWSRTFETPEGGRLAMESFRGKPLLINFWATWCPPCVEELPLLDRFYRENSGKGFQVVGIAIDQAAAVRAFLARMPLGFPVALRTGWRWSNLLATWLADCRIRWSWGRMATCCIVKWARFQHRTWRSGPCSNEAGGVADVMYSYGGWLGLREKDNK